MLKKIHCTCMYRRVWLLATVTVSDVSRYGVNIASAFKSIFALDHHLTKHGFDHQVHLFLAHVQ